MKSVEKNKNKYYYKLDIIRILSCIAILLYHLNILKGGYLAVCIFFVLSGYLSCVSLFKKDKVDLFKYYLDRLKKIYLPLIIVVFITCGIVLLFKDLVLLNLKPEVYSILLSYNNYWQIGANVDYFARFISSPFMHLWYISILLQFELVVPFIFMLFKKIGDKSRKIIYFILLFISLLSCSYFCYLSFTSNNIMRVYYDTFSRIFSLLFGFSLGFIHHYHGSLVKKSCVKYSDYFYYIYLIISIILFIFIESSSNLFCVSMVLISLISVRLIEYSILDKDKKFDNIKLLSSITYEVYLVQYPIIFILDYLNISGVIKVIITIVLSFVIGYLLNASLKFKFNSQSKILKKIFFSLLVIIVSMSSAHGLIMFISSHDYSKDMKKLELELEKNEEKMKQRQKEYLEKARLEKEDFNNKLKSLENDQSKLGEVVSSLRVIGVGDSVMLGAVDSLYGMFPNGYFDAKKSRTNYEANGILLNLKNNGMLGDVAVFSLGTNGSGPDYLMDEIMETLDGRVNYWINVVNDRDVHVNERLNNYAASHSNMRIIDWVSYSRGHGEWFVADGIHLTDAGKLAYAKCIYEAIYNDYLSDLNNRIQTMIKENDIKEKSKFLFFGNDLLLNISGELENNYLDSTCFVKDYDEELLIDDIDSLINNGSITNNLVFMFDSNFNITDSFINTLSSKLEEANIYIVTINKEEISNKGVFVVDFSKEINKNKDYLMVDGVHLSKSGNEALTKYIIDKIK